MNKIYFDNAATTLMYDEVIEEMMKTMKYQYGNPSSIHSFGVEAKSAIENARKSIAKNLNVPSQDIFFTSCGTEANNLIIRSCVEYQGVTHIITSPLEHKCVLETTCDMMMNKGVKVSVLSVNNQGDIDLNELEELLQQSSDTPTLVSLMHANNEFGNIYPIKEIATLAHKYGAKYHSDTVQTIGHYPMDLQDLGIDFCSSSAHKFHGPKGAGFAYIKNKSGLKPQITGGGQEKNMRSGTENVYGIVGMAKALDISLKEHEKQYNHIIEIKKYAIEQFTKHFPDIECNGRSGEIDNSLYCVLNVFFPTQNTLLGFQLDMKGVALSQGSACSSGASKPSIALSKIRTDEELKTHLPLRISFSHWNTKEEIDVLIQALQEIQQTEKENQKQKIQTQTQ